LILILKFIFNIKKEKKAATTDNEKIAQKGVERSQNFIPPLHKKETDHLRTFNIF